MINGSGVCIASLPPSTSDSPRPSNPHSPPSHRNTGARALVEPLPKPPLRGSATAGALSDSPAPGPMRIALLSAFLFDRSVGGIENHVRFVIEELQTRGHDIIVFRPLFGSSARDSEAIVDGVRVKTIQL